MKFQKSGILLAALLSAHITFCQQSKRIESSGVDISYQSFGSGMPLLIINGGPGFSSEGFVPLAKEISAMGYKTILFDQRGTGKSLVVSTDSSNVNMDLMVADMEAIREDLNLDNWAVLGHSFGGMLGSYYTANFPERVNSLILSSSGGLDLDLLNTARDDIYARLTEIQIDSLNYWRVRRDSSKIASLKFAEIYAHAYVFDKQFVPVVAERLTQGDLALNALVWQDLIRMNFDCKPKLASFKNEVLIIQGKEDIVPTKLALQAKKVFANSYLALLDSSVHYPWLDQPEKFFATVDLFLKNVEQKKKDKDDIQEVLMNYLESIYKTEPSLVPDIADASLQKSGFYFSSKKQEWSYNDMTYAELIHTAESYNKKKWIPQDAPKSIELIEIKEKVALAKVKAIWGFDYVLLSKEKDKWKLNKILWQSYGPLDKIDMISLMKAKN